MNITKTISTLSLAFAMVGGAVVLAPSEAKANKKSHISYEALNKGKVPQTNRAPQNSRPGKEANPYNRGCSKQHKCRG